MDINKRIDDLEIKMTYQEELLNELNIIVAKQQDIIERLIKESQQGSTGTEQAQGSLFEQLKSEKPPHY